MSIFTVGGFGVNAIINRGKLGKFP